MGAESSISASVASLNTTLDRIERRLLTIEDIHLHHDVSLNRNDCVIISGCAIKCNNNIDLVIGPVIGKLGSTFVRILLEVHWRPGDYNSLTVNNKFSRRSSRNNAKSINDEVLVEISLYTFRTDEVLNNRRFVKCDTLQVKENCATAYTVRDLEPGIPYCIYVGGVRGQQMIHRFVEFATPRSDLSNFKMIFGKDGHADHIEIDELNPWESLEQQVQAEKRETSIIFVHAGNLLSINSLLERKIKDILDYLSNEDITDVWLEELNIFEDLIHSTYCKLFESTQLTKITRRCSCIFLPGESESGRDAFNNVLHSLLTHDNPRGPMQSSQNRETRESKSESESAPAYLPILSDVFQEEKKANVRPGSQELESKRSELNGLVVAAVARLVK